MENQECKTIGMALIENAPNILMALGTCITAIGSIIAAYFAYQAKIKATSADETSAKNLQQSKDNAESLTALRSS